MHIMVILYRIQAYICFFFFFFFFFFIYFRLSRLLLEGRTKMVSAHWFFFVVVAFFFSNHIWNFNDLIIHGAGMGLSEFADYIGWRLAFSVHTT